MDPTTPPICDFDATLAELTALGMRGIRAITRILEIEQQTAEILAAGLPDPAHQPTSLADAITTGKAVDAAAAALAAAIPRVDILSRALDRSSRAVRRAVALRRRLQTGWPRPTSDTRAAMQRRQVAAGVAKKIRQQAEGDAAERFFDDLTDRMDDPALDAELQAHPVEAVIARICRDIGLAETAYAPFLNPTAPSSTPNPHPPDSG